MKKTTRMMENVLVKLRGIYNESDFLSAILSALKNDYECEHFLRLVDKYKVQTPDNVLIFAIIISEAGNEKKHRGDYLKDIDRRIEEAMLEEVEEDFDEDDDKKPEAFDGEEQDKKLTCETGGNDMELREALKNVEVKNYKNGKPCNFLKLLKKADAGSVKAMYDFVQTVFHNEFADDDLNDAIAKRQVLFMKKLSKIKAYRYMRIFIGDAYEKGSGVHKDINKAIKWFKKAARGGIKFGNECIGMIYFNGNELPADYEKAYKYFTKDNCKKSFCTTYALGEMYRNGWYVEKDLDVAYSYYSDIVYKKPLIDQNGNNMDEIDSYFWRACYRVACAEHYGEGAEIHLGSALEKLFKAMLLYEDRTEKAKDITWEDMKKEWKKLNKDAGWM